MLTDEDILDMETHHGFICYAIENCPPQKEYFSALAKRTISDPDLKDPIVLYMMAYTTGYAKALHDISSGKLSIKITKEKVE